jgi:glycosyltransferase involved in cell wall biosynthesis
MPDVCLVIPCFNEGRRLPVDAFTAFLGKPDCPSTVCFVNDGSSDDTPAVLARVKAIAPDVVDVVTLDSNRGKAEAVRYGMLHALSTGRYSVVGYWDADLATPLTEVARFVEVMHRNPHCEFALGSRVKRLGALVDRRGSRHVVGRMFATMTSVLLDLPVYDSQCGAKLLRAGVASQLFAEPFHTRWLFDIELLVRLRALKPGLGSAIEVPLTEWHDVGGSKLGVAWMVRSPIDLLRIRSRYPTADA